MTTITVEIDKDKDLSAVEKFIAGLGLTYHISPKENMFYTNELKNVLDQRYNNYLQRKQRKNCGLACREKQIMAPY